MNMKIMIFVLLFLAACAVKADLGAGNIYPYGRLIQVLHFKHKKRRTFFIIHPRDS